MAYKIKKQKKKKFAHLTENFKKKYSNQNN